MSDETKTEGKTWREQAEEAEAARHARNLEIVRIADAAAEARREASDKAADARRAAADASAAERNRTWIEKETAALERIALAIEKLRP